MINYAGGEAGAAAAPQGDYDTFIGALREAGLYGKATVVFDPVGGRYAEAAFRAMAPYGRYVVFGFASGGVDPKSAFPQFPANIMLMKGIVTGDDTNGVCCCGTMGFRRTSC